MQASHIMDETALVRAAQMDAQAFGEIVNGKMLPSPHAEIVQKWWKEIPNHFSNGETGEFVVMPNHIHGTIFIMERSRGTVPVPDEKKRVRKTMGGETPPQEKPTLGQIVAYYKYQSTKEMNALARTGVVTKFWQRNYYEHIIRDEKGLKAITEYIESNPLLWEDAAENPVKARQ
ncbi:MAG: transposase [Chloroflexi bacterium]|nr:transposase [Chloroflexota bacterium]